jgi:hypothetical protein
MIVAARRPRTLNEKGFLSPRSSSWQKSQVRWPARETGQVHALDRLESGK